MRRAGFITLMAFAVMVSPAQGATVEVSVGNNAFTPADVTITQGDAIQWKWVGPDTNHSTTADEDGEDRWDSDLGNSSPNHPVGHTFAKEFQRVGEFRYHDKANPGITGRIVVVKKETNSFPPADTLPPTFGKPVVSLKRRRVTFRLSEDADVAYKLRGPTRRARSVDGKAGANSIRLPKRLRPGRYAVVLQATDGTNNASAPVSVKFRVRRR